MISKFLNSYKDAESLDTKEFRRRHPRKRADFLLFDRQVICEVRQFDEIDIPRQVERVWKKNDQPAEFVGVHIADRIREELSEKCKQVTATRTALRLPRSLGLIVLESLRRGDLSTVVLVEATEAEFNRKRGLEGVDGVLCLDLTNTFTSDDDVVRLCQMIVLPTQRGQELGKFVDRLMLDFTEQSKLPMRTGYDLSGARHGWRVDGDGKFEEYWAKADFNLQREPSKGYRSYLTVLSRWAWVIGLGIALLQWLLPRRVSR